MADGDGMSLKEFRERLNQSLNVQDYLDRIKEFRKGRERFTDWIISCIYGGAFKNAYSNKIYKGKNSANASHHRRTCKFFTEELGYEHEGTRITQAMKRFMDCFSGSITFSEAVEKLREELKDKGRWEKRGKDFENLINILTDDGQMLSSLEVQSHRINKNAEKIIRLFKDGEKQVVLTGAPGTGKTYLAKKIAREWIKNHNNLGENNQRKVDYYIDFVQFHPSYDYTDFIEGLRPTGVENGQLSFGIKNGVFKEFCKKALKDSENDYFFIIDEINRAELSKVFGELMYSLELNYRGPEGAVRTQYSTLQDKDTIFDPDLDPDSELFGKFYIPENVYIIGTMNDIDRSVEVFDFALRRRFAWYELKANDVMRDVLESMLAEELSASSHDNDKIIEELTGRAIKLNKCISSEEGKKFGLNDQYHIGPAYFGQIDIKEGQLDWQGLWDLYIGQILREYVRNRKGAEEFINKCRETVLGADVVEQPDSIGGGSD